jgi:outer membrane protein insertion porin family
VSVPGGLRLVICLALGVTILASPAPAAPEDFEGKPIASIAFDPPQRALLPEEMARLLPLKVGTPLLSATVRDAIEKLFATGRYEDILIDAEAASGGGVALRILTQPSWFVGRISVVGVPEPPNAGQLVNATKLQLGTQTTPGMIRQAVEGVEGVLRANGFYQAKVQVEENYEPGIQQLDLRFIVDTGNRAHFTTPVIKGTPEKTPEQITHITHWRRILNLGWKPVTDQGVSSGLERIRRAYQKGDNLLAKVSLEEMDYDEDSGRAKPTLNIQSGPKVRIRTEGAKIGSGKLRQLVPIYQEQAVDRDLLVEGERNLEEYFQGQGYFEAHVDFRERQVSVGQEQIIYDIDRGDRHKLMHMEVKGNRYFDTATIRERMFLLPASFLRFRYGRYSTEYLRRDTEAIKDLYRSNGFRDVDVTYRVADQYRGKAKQLAVYLQIEEGQQTFVKSVEIAGLGDEDRDYVMSVLQSQPGQPYSDLNLANDQETVLNYFYNNGYPNAKFEVATGAAASPHRVDLRITVTPGDRKFVRQVVVTGLEHTNPSLVDERITLKPGDPLSLSRMTESQRKLYDLGIFARVDTAQQDPDGSEENKYLLYRFEEASKYSTNFGFGAEVARIGSSSATSLTSAGGETGFSPRASIGVSRLNFLGLGHTVSLQTRISNIERRAGLTYLAPQFIGSENLSLTLSSIYEDSRNVLTFSARRLEASAQLSQRFSKANSGQYRLTFRRVKATDIKITQGLVPLLSQTVRVGIASATFIQDRRDDPVDTHRGIYNSVDAGVALHALLSQTNFNRFIARNSTYHRITREVILARTVTFGWLQPFTGANIPVPERFFAGGANSHRGFPENQAGPRDLTTGFPTGGNVLLTHQTELRFPLLGDNIGGVIFHDAGNIYASLDKVSFRLTQRDVTDFDYMVHAAGFGIRYRTPIGPIRVDLAYSINSPRFKGCRGDLNALLFECDPVRFPGNITVQRISRFQFHFSLGQTF